MPAIQRVTAQQIIDAYRDTGSVWKAGKRLGIYGQSVWERLKALGHPIPSRKWTAEEIDELCSLAEHCTLTEISKRLGRPYYGVAIKISRLGFSTRFGNKQRKKIPRGSGFTKESTAKLVSELARHEGSLRNFCRMKGIGLELTVRAIQNYEMDFWRAYAEAHSELKAATCQYCGDEYYPMTAKQTMCSRKCSATRKRDEQYFGGNRRKTIGLAEGVCQLCLQHKDKGLSSHHVLGKENDPNDECLVALCQGCHRLVTDLAGRKFADHPESWESLIQLVLARRMAEKSKEFVGVYACVEMEYMTKEQAFEEEEYEQAALDMAG